MPKPDQPQKTAPAKTVPSQPLQGQTTKAARPVRKKRTNRTSRKKRKQPITRWTILAFGLEIAGLTTSAITAIVVLLGVFAEKFSGTRFLTSLLPFAAGVLGFILAAALFLTGWLRLRQWLQTKSLLLPPIFALSIAIALGSVALQGHFLRAFGNFRTLVGGKEEASRVTLTHQIFAAYRRSDHEQLRQLIERSHIYGQDIEAAAESFDLDPDLLYGVAAAESSYLPRDSKDGGKGLFQITHIPDAAMRDASNHLGISKPLPADHRQNSFIAAATLKYYLAQMKNDLFLGLLAYNIGPTNGGLRFIMQQYGATDFITAQPYLQQLPRDYPVRVLCYALAFRLMRKEGKLLAYEEGLNAVRIQHIGIPGL